MRVKAFLVGLAVALLWALPAFAQGNPTGKVSGRVMSDGQPVPGVLVTATSPNLQGSKTTSTSSNGDYLFPALPAGDYTISFELEGMQSVRRELTEVDVERLPGRDALLEQLLNRLRFGDGRVVPSHDRIPERRRRRIAARRLERGVDAVGVCAHAVEVRARRGADRRRLVADLVLGRDQGQLR